MGRCARAEKFSISTLDWWFISADLRSPGARSTASESSGGAPLLKGAWPNAVPGAVWFTPRERPRCLSYCCCASGGGCEVNGAPPDRSFEHCLSRPYYSQDGRWGN